MDMRSPYAASFPITAPAGAHWTDTVVKQGHVDYCAAHGHATWTEDGVDMGRCPRCGTVTAATVAPAAAAAPTALAQRVNARLDAAIDAAADTARRAAHVYGSPERAADDAAMVAERAARAAARAAERAAAPAPDATGAYDTTAPEYRAAVDAARARFDALTPAPAPVDYAYQVRALSGRYLAPVFGYSTAPAARAAGRERAAVLGADAAAVRVTTVRP